MYDVTVPRLLQKRKQGVTITGNKLNRNARLDRVHCGETPQLGSASPPMMVNEMIYSRIEISGNRGYKGLTVTLSC
jgi:hypothetical protein